MILLGEPLSRACELLSSEGFNYKLVPYLGTKPYSDADSAKIVRANKIDNFTYELVFCEFKTFLSKNSQG